MVYIRLKLARENFNKVLLKFHSPNSAFLVPEDPGEYILAAFDEPDVERFVKLAVPYGLADSNTVEHTEFDKYSPLSGGPVPKHHFRGDANLLPLGITFR